MSSPESSPANPAEAFREQYQRNPSLTAMQFLEHHRDLSGTPELVVEILYEEYCRHLESNGAISIDELTAGFPSVRSKLEIVIEFDAVFRSQAEQMRFPEPGDNFHEFQIVDELGRGANGRVFIASQPALSDRKLVLKLSPLMGSEHLSLARLQHSSIVPLFFANEDHESRIRLLAMPYLGGITLHDAMMSMHAIAVKDRTGLDFANAIQQQGDCAHEEQPGSIQHPAIGFLKSATYEQATCWIVACLADGLHYAHQRGLAHLDVKPSNILLAGDGQPMLLDFHLAKDLSALSSNTVMSLGGTPGYVAPEQNRAMRSIANGTEVTEKVDQRADIFSLGLILRDLLSGAIPPTVDTVEDSPTRDQAIDKDLGSLSGGQLKTLLSSCLAEDPSQRPADASSLATKLRHIAVGPTNQRRDSSLSLVIAFLAGCAITTVFMWLLSSVPKDRSTPVETIDPGRLLIVDELHQLLKRADAQNILQSSNVDEQYALLRSARQLLAQESKLLKLVDSTLNPTISIQLRDDLVALETVANRLSAKLEAAKASEEP